MSCTYWNGPCRCQDECARLGCRDVRSASTLPPAEPEVSDAMILRLLTEQEIPAATMDSHISGTARELVGVIQFVLAALRPSAAPEPAQENKRLRRMLCIAHAGHAAYMDDGEAQDNRSHPCIDFLRDSPDDIEKKLFQRAHDALSAAAPAIEPAIWLVVKEHAWDMGDGGRKELAYLLPAAFPTFASHDEAMAFRKERPELPLGWVVGRFAARPSAALAAPPDSSVHPAGLAPAPSSSGTGKGQA